MMSAAAADLTSNGSAAPNGSHQSPAAPATQLDYSRYLSKLAKVFPQSAIRGLFKAELVPGMVSFLAGKPNPETFPFQSISITLKPEPDQGAGTGETIQIKGEDLDQALQYGPTAGIPKLNNWLTQFVSEAHDRPIIKPEDAGSSSRTEWRVSVGAGSQDLLVKAFSALLDPEDSILVESPCYSGVLPTMQMTPAHIVPISSDAQGVSPESLRSVLQNWHSAPSTSSKRFPKCLYTIPIGANPGGTTAGEERKREVLAIAREFGILILEDDPYYFLSFEGLDEDPVTRKRPKSYFALENEEREKWGDGRVLRFESFSKILSAGLRLGFVAGPKPLVDAMDLLTASINLQPAGPPQALALALLEHWGKEGFLRHVDRVAAFYAARRNNFEAKVRKVLGASKDGSRPAVAEWVSPVAGMFLWLQLKLPPSEKSKDGDSKDLIETKARAKGFLGIPGISFLPGAEETHYVRTSFSLVPEDQVERGLEALRSAIEEAWQEAGLELK